ncbi:MAG: hypothetical protein ACWGMZ_03225 [Thermoguttaceae bacterium]
MNIKDLDGVFVRSVVFCLLVFLPDAFGQRLFAYQQQRHSSHHASPRTAPHSRAQANQHEMYAVVEVGGELKVVPKSSLNTLKKNLADEYRQALKAYQQSKKTKHKSQGAPLKAPKKQTLKILKSSFKTQAEADKYCEKIIEARSKNGGKKSANVKK